MAVYLSSGYAADKIGENLLTYSEQFDNAVWSKIQTTVTANAVIAPDGTLTADKLVESTATSSHYTERSVSRDANIETTFSVYLKAKERDTVLIHLYDWAATANNISMLVSLSTGQIINAVATGSSTLNRADMDAVGDGWFRVTLGGIPGVSTGATIRPRVALVNSSTTYTGDGTSGIYLWGAQLEEGGLGPYVKTENVARPLVQPATHARILWDNLPGTISATSEEEGFEASNAGAVDTASWWQPSAASGTWTIAYSGAQNVDAVGIGAHTLSGVTVTIQAEIASVWTTVASMVPTDNSAILALFPEVSCTGIRIVISASARIGVVYTGRALEMQRAGYTSVGLIDLRRQAGLTSYISEGGQLMARFVQRRGLQSQYSWNHLTEDWYRANFDPFALAAQTEPFFIAARPQGYASDVAYAWVNDPITPSRMGVNNFLSVGFTAMGHADA